MSTSWLIFETTDTYPSFGIHSGSISQENPDNIGLLSSGSKMQSGLTSHRWVVRFSIVLYQVDHNVHVAHKGGNVKRGQPRLKEGSQTKLFHLQIEKHHIQQVILGNDLKSICFIFQQSHSHKMYLHVMILSTFVSATDYYNSRSTHKNTSQRKGWICRILLPF